MMRKALTFTTALIGLGVWSCSGDSLSVNPAPAGGTSEGTGGAAATGGSGGAATGGTGASSGAGGSSGTAGAAGSSPGPILRTVIVRDVFEDFDDPDNLMLDGGFELSGEMSSSWGINAYGSMKYGNGAVCRSGIRCGIAEANKGIYGFLVSPRTGTLELSFWAQTHGASCDSLGVYVQDAYSPSYYPPQVSIASVSLESDGWCRIEGVFDALALAVPIIYFEPKQGRAFIDDVVVHATASTRSLPSAPVPLSPAVHKRLEDASKRAMRLLRGAPGTRRSLRAGAPWTADIEPWVR